MAKKRVHTAKNWTAADAVKVIVEGKDFVAIADIMKRFPMFAYYAMRVNEAGVTLLSALPEYFTARKVNSYLSGAATDDADEALTDEEIDDTDADEDEDEIEEKPTKRSGKRGRPAKKSEPEDDEDEDDDDEEEEEVKSAKKSKKGAKKSYKRVVDDDDEGDDDDEKPVKKSSKGKKKSKPVDDDEDDFDFDD